MNHPIPSRRFSAIIAAIGIFLLTGCSLTPSENRPILELPSAYAQAGGNQGATLAATEDPGRWKPAEPADQQMPSPWWRVFADPALVQLEEEALKANPDVAVAMARLKQARALTASSEAARAPHVDLGFGPNRQRTTGTAAGHGDGAPGATQTLWRAQASVAYEADIFGRVASDVTAARADEAQQRALAHQMLLLVQADVARAYFSLRQNQGEYQLLTAAVTLREEAVALLERKLGEGAVAQVVVDQARTELFSTRAEKKAVERQTALTAHALATLLGKAPATIALDVKPLAMAAIQLPAQMPSALLERRPDIAAAERAMVAENARIGAAKAAFFPSLSLTGSLGYESSELSNLGNWSQRTFLLGPLVGGMLSIPLLDGGRREAGLTRARARYEERVAEYRKTVLQAFREVEDALVSMRTVGERIADLKDAELASARVARSERIRFDEGDVDYLAVVDAERTHLSRQQLRLQSEGERMRASVDLVRALGGGWNASN